MMAIAVKKRGSSSLGCVPLIRRLTAMPVTPNNVVQRVSAGHSPDKADAIVTSQTTPMATSMASRRQARQGRGQFQIELRDAWFMPS